jgi:hypothetical protein
VSSLLVEIVIDRKLISGVDALLFDHFAAYADLRSQKGMAFFCAIC